MDKEGLSCHYCIPSPEISRLSLHSEIQLCYLFSQHKQRKSVNLVKIRTDEKY